MKQYYLTILFAAANLLVYGQQTQTKDSTLTRTVVVEREYTPEILDAQKINIIPKVVPPVSHHPAVDYDEQFRPATQVPTSIMPPYIAPAVSSYVQPGLFRIGFGNLNQWDALAAYRFKPSARDVLHLSLYAAGDKSNFNLSDEGNPWSSSHMNGRVDVLYNHHFDRSELTARGDFGLRKFDMLPSSRLDKQQFTQGNLSLALRSTTEEERLLHYDAKASFAYYSRKEYTIDREEKPSETTLNLDGHVWTLLTEKQWIDLGLTLNQYLYQGDDNLKNQTTLTLIPAYRFENESWKIRLGLKSDLAFGYGKKWQVAPDIEAEYTTGSHVLYAHVKGGRIANDFRRIELIGPYANLPYLQADATYEQLNASAGWKGSPLPDLRIHLYGGYQQLRNDMVTIRDAIAGGSSYPCCQSLCFTKSHNLFTGATMSYNYREQFGLRLSALYRNWSLDEWEQVAFKPELDLDAALDLRPLKELQLTAGYRHTTLSNHSYEAMSDLYFQGSYALHQVWHGLGAFIEIHNLLDKSYELTPCVPALGLRIMGGVKLQF